MYHHYIYLILILALSPLALCSNNTLKCGDCNKENVKLCQIESETGASCFKKGGKRPKMEARRKYTPEKAPMTTDLNTCIQPGMNIDPDAEICCSWSPKTGCQLVLWQEHLGEFCSTCRLKNEEYEGLEPCPCKTISRSGCDQLKAGDIKQLIGLLASVYIVSQIYYLYI